MDAVFSLRFRGSVREDLSSSMSNFRYVPSSVRREIPVRLVQDFFDALSTAFARYDLLGISCLSAHNVTTLQGSLDVTDRNFAPLHPVGFIQPSEGLSPRSGPADFSAKLRSAIRLLGFYRSETFTRKFNTALLDAACSGDYTPDSFFCLWRISRTWADWRWMSQYPPGFFLRYFW